MRARSPFVVRATRARSLFYLSREVTAASGVRFVRREYRQIKRKNVIEEAPSAQQRSLSVVNREFVLHSAVESRNSPAKRFENPSGKRRVLIALMLRSQLHLNSFASAVIVESNEDTVCGYNVLIPCVGV